MSWPPGMRPPERSWTLPQFIIDGVWEADKQPVWGQHWALHRIPATYYSPLADPLTTVPLVPEHQEVTFEGSDERFELIDIQHGDTPEETRIFLARIPKENP